ncbi:MAG: hypothetical protein OEY01_08395 [Desulfobulbaceae bacterium]|nr:hypothetical protein [Desulfobulbaceae bacterium]HIJ79023.1 hypothetical protein [Deltaproteobacteria bacterium]
MSEKSTIEKLQILLPHWVEHNNNHEAEFSKWAEAAGQAGEKSLAELLNKAVASMAATDAILKEALKLVGGPGKEHHHHHHHGHDHDHDHHHN